MNGRLLYMTIHAGHCLNVPSMYAPAPLGGGGVYFFGSSICFHHRVLFYVSVSIPFQKFISVLNEMHTCRIWLPMEILLIMIMSFSKLKLPIRFLFKVRTKHVPPSFIIIFSFIAVRCVEPRLKDIILSFCN